MPTQLARPTDLALSAQLLPVSQLDELEGNYNHGDDEAVAASYREFGQVKPIVARRRGRSKRLTVYAGNTQLRTARELQYENLAVVVLPSTWSDEKCLAFAIADNTTAKRSTEDAEALLTMLDAVNDSNLRAAASYSDTALAELRESVFPTPAVPGSDDVPVPPKTPISVRGDVWLLGHHRVMCGDSTAAGDLTKLMGDSVASMVFTDPPYGVDYQTKMKPGDGYARHRRTDGLVVSNDGLGVDGTRQLIAAALGNATKHWEPGGPFYVCSPSGDMELTFRSALVDAGLELREAIVWVKNVFVFGRQDYQWHHESILYGWRDGAAHYWNGGRSQDTVWEIDRPRVSELHPTMKPLALVSRAIANSCKPGGTVLDLFGGAGSTLMACEQERRINRTMELDPSYTDTICLRWQLETGGKPVRESDGQPVSFES